MEKRAAAPDTAASATLDDLLAKEDPEAVKAYQAARRQKEAGDLKKAVESMEKLVKKHPTFYIGLIDLGMILAAQQENDRALELFTRAQTARPEHSWVYIGLGMVFNNKKDYPGAVQHLEKAVSLEPKLRQRPVPAGLRLIQPGRDGPSTGLFPEGG